MIDRDVKIIPVTTEEYPTKAVRPRNSYLSKDKIQSTLGIKLRPWQESLDEFINSTSKNN